MLTDDNGNCPGADGPTLAVTLDETKATVDTTADAKQAVVATVNITSDADADKTAEVTLKIECSAKESGETITAPTAPAATAATDGSHAFTPVDIPLGIEGECEFWAEATLGGEKKTSEKVKFTVEAGTPTTPAGPGISITSFIKDETDATKFVVIFEHSNFDPAAAAATDFRIHVMSDVAEDFRPEQGCCHSRLPHGVQCTTHRSRQKPHQTSGATIQPVPQMLLLSMDLSSRL